jgi:predicted small secreted protein
MFSRRLLSRFFALGIVATLFAALVTGCNTLEGAGEDMEEGGEAVQDAAD